MVHVCEMHTQEAIGIRHVQGNLYGWHAKGMLGSRCDSDSASNKDDSKVSGMDDAKDSYGCEEDYGQPEGRSVASMNVESTTPFLCGSNILKLDATLMLMNVCRTHKATNACIT